MFEKKLDFVTWKKRMQYHFDIYKIIGVFLGKWIESTGRQWNGCGEQFEVGVLTSPFSAVSSRVCAQSRLVMVAESLVSVWVTLNGRWACALMDRWTPVLQGRAWEPERAGREAACELPFCLQAVILRKYLAREQRNVKEDCGRSHQFNRKGVIKSPGGKAAR